MFGVEDMDGYYKASFPEMSSHSMNAAGLLSDCQEMLLHMNDDIYISNGQAATAEEQKRIDTAEKIRLHLNMAKWILSHHLEDAD